MEQQDFLQKEMPPGSGLQLLITLYIMDEDLDSWDSQNPSLTGADAFGNILEWKRTAK